MKKKIIVLAALLTVTTLSLLAQTPPHPPADAGSGGGPVGSNPSGAHIDGGLTILIALAGAYAGKKTIELKRESSN